ncbi:MAG: ABC transporter ATP-binding protein [Legionellaceae bacterium]|nr:ABC transporter ATP-binding protein [Legionellaceae bacterium]
MDKKTFKIFQSLWSFISNKRRKQLCAILTLTIVSAISEVVYLASILPFIGVVINPEKIFSSHFMSGLINYLKIQTANDLILPLTITFASLALINGILRLLLIRFSLKVAHATGTDISIDIYKKTLYQPYHVHISRNSSDIISAIAQKSIATTNVIVSLVTFGTVFILFSAIIVAMLYVNTQVTIVAGLIMTSAYGIMALLTRKNLSQNGQIIASKQNDVMKSLQEGLGAIRDVILDNTQEHYSKAYSLSAQQLQSSRAENMFISQAPRYFIETFAVILVALFILVSSYQTNSVVDLLPTLGFFAISAQRLLPLMQQMYGYWSEIIGNKAALLDVLELLKQKLPDNINKLESPPLNLQKEIKLKDVSFQYHKNSHLILNKINLTIPKGARVGIIGSTGSGKSTALDILMGLIEPTTGNLLVDNKIISSENRRAWQKTIAHVPQNIFLANLTIAENIAFGNSLEEIDFNRVQKAAIQANAHEFIMRSEKKYQTTVGERGIRLSGGQRQRIGIARALYKNASVLCFDEATSALDNNTEQEIIDTLNSLDKKLTIFIIAHRLTTIKNCSHFIKIDNGQIVSLDSYSSITC